jgi:hypothetical protein
MTDTIRTALNRAFQLGQTYWQQADSESYKQNAKSDVTLDVFRALVDETCAALAAPPAAPAVGPQPLGFVEIDAEWRKVCDSRAYPLTRDLVRAFAMNIERVVTERLTGEKQ